VVRPARPGLPRQRDPPEVTARVSIEAGVAQGWYEVVGVAGRIISLEHYGASAAAAKLFEEFGFTAANVVQAAKESIADAESTLAPTHRAPAGPKGPVDIGGHPSGTIS